MRMLFKIAGLITILLTCTAIGFLKSLALKGRFESLLYIKNSLLKLKEKLRLHSGDKSKLLNDCFTVPPQTIPHLDNDDKALLNDFLHGLGKGDTTQEIERCVAFLNLFETKTNDAKADFNNRQKLYKTLGFLGGIFLCIFFI